MIYPIEEIDDERNGDTGQVVEVGKAKALQDVRMVGEEDAYNTLINYISYKFGPLSIWELGRTWHIGWRYQSNGCWDWRRE